MDKILTISIATYNGEKYLEECLNSFIDFDFNGEIEVLIIDDGSTDKTREICQKYVNDYPNIYKYIYKTNGGWGSTVYEGAKNANGKYFKLLDCDDYYDKKELNKLINKMKFLNSDIVFTDCITFIDGKNKVFEDTKKLNTKIISNKEMTYQEAKNNEYNLNSLIRVHNIAIKTKILKENIQIFKLLEHCYYTDIEYCTKCLALSNNYIYLNYQIYHYRIDREGQSVSIVGIRKHYKESLKVIYFVLDFINYHKNNNYYVLEYVKYMIGTIYNNLLMLEISKKSKNEIVKFNSQLEKDYSSFIPKDWKSINMLRRSNFKNYMIVAYLKQFKKKYLEK